MKDQKETRPETLTEDEERFLQILHTPELRPKMLRQLEALGMLESFLKIDC